MLHDNAATFVDVDGIVYTRVFEHGSLVMQFVGVDTDVGSDGDTEESSLSSEGSERSEVENVD